MQNKLLYVFIFGTMLTGLVQAQFNRDEFLYRTKTIYHSLQGKGLENFTCWITSDLFLETTKEFSEEEIFPLELIWKSPNMFYYIRRALPPIENEEMNAKVQELQLNMVQALKGLLIDWQRFCAGNILDDLPETYLLTTVGDSAFIQYENIEANTTIKVKMTFGLNGICLKVAVGLPDKNEIVNTYPAYRLIKDKWLCTGWTVQTIKNGSVESGFTVNLRSREFNDYWIPERLNLQLQKKEAEEILYTRTYIFKNIILNKELKFKK